MGNIVSIHRWALSCLVSGVLLSSPLALADGVDTDFDATLKLMDGIEQALADSKPEVDNDDIILLFGQDRDANGIRDEDQLAMLSAILMGQYTREGNVYGTNQLSPSVVTAIQSGFTANKSRVNTDITLTGTLCFGLTLAGQSCNLGDLISQGDPAIKDGLLTLLAAYMTLGEPGIVNYNGMGQDFVETWFENLIQIALVGTDQASLAGDIAGNISFNPNNYQKFGAAGTNYLGAAGNIDSNLNATTNLQEYQTVSDRESWLSACSITPPLRIAASPVDATLGTGQRYALLVGIAGGLDALGLPGTESQWSTVATVDNAPVITVVRPFAPGLDYALGYLLLAPPLTTAQTTYLATVRDGVWSRSAETAVVTVNLDTNFRIEIQPLGGTYEPGAPVLLTVETAGGNAVPLFQWFKDGDAIDGATESTYSFPAVAGAYWCVIKSNTDGTKAAVELVSETALINVGGEEGEGAFEGGIEGEGMLEGEGAVEGSLEGEGATEGEGAEEGQLEGEGAVDGEGAAEGEGAFEGEGGDEGEGTDEGEGSSEGEGAVEGIFEGEGEGEDGALCVVALTSAQVAPPSGSQNSGELRVYPREGGGLRYEVTHTIAVPNGASVRLGNTCENGGSIISISNAASPIVLELTGQQLAQLPTGPKYLLIRSAGYPNGEIRGVFGCPDPSQDDVVCPGGPEGEGSEEGVAEGEGTAEGEGALEGEGGVEGEGAFEGTMEGTVEGDFEGGFEGSPEGSAEGSVEGALEGEGAPEGEEGEQEEPRLVLALQVLTNYGFYDGNSDGRVSLVELIARATGFTQQVVESLDLNSNGTITIAELLSIVGGGYVHSADRNGDGRAELNEILRVIQLFNAGGYRCASNPGASEDGYQPGLFNGALDSRCLPHASDYLPLGGDGLISLSELLRLIQLFNVGVYSYCPGESEDTFCASGDN